MGKGQDELSFVVGKHHIAVNVNEVQFGAATFRVVGNHAELSFISVSEEMRGRGLGKALGDAFVAQMKKMGVTTVEMTVVNPLTARIFSQYGRLACVDDGQDMTPALVEERMFDPLGVVDAILTIR
jgi:GNAT superfamily N-acetyltransferase